MTLSPADAALFKKLHLKNLVDLALFLPKKLENLTLSSAPCEDFCTQEVQILRTNSHSGKLMGVVWCKGWEIEAAFIFFHPSRWHFGAFKAGKECIFNAKMNLYNGIWQFSNPKIISKAGFFAPKYQVAGVKDESIAKLIHAYVSKANLSASGLDERRASLLVALHAYDERSYQLLNALKAQQNAVGQSTEQENRAQTQILNVEQENRARNLSAERNLQDFNAPQISQQNAPNLSATQISQPNLALNSATIQPQIQPNAILQDLKYIEIYNFLRRLKNKKHTPKSFEIELFDISEWLKGLPFKPTDDQMRAISDIKGDLRSANAKRRIIMGDVGCGKTLVLLAAALLVYPKQAVLMAPTSILAQQLFDEAKRLLPNFMRLVLLTGGKKDKNLEQNLQNAHLIIGTHALIHLQKHNAVLVMVDEQHRFGSNQRQKINDLAKSDEKSPHFIQFSATPIPRTLSMIQSELVSFSFIRQMPFRKDIQTFCVQGKDFALITERIKTELAKGNQIAIIYPLVNESETGVYMPLEKAKEYWQKHYDSVYTTHGKDKNKEAVLLEFREKGKILLATTVMEVGISLPRLSTIIIVGAEKLGLATLHQLRGRVGRVGLPSFCYLYTKLKTMPARLIEFSQTLDGFVIAELDLKNRLSGDLLDGFAQHGNEFKFFDFATDEKILEQVKADLQG